MGNFAGNLNLGKRVLPPPPRLYVEAKISKKRLEQNSGKKTVLSHKRVLYRITDIV